MAVVTNVTPVGRVPVSVSVGVGIPVVVTVKLPAVPTVKVVLVALVIAGAWLTVRVKLWVAEKPLAAVKVRVIDAAGARLPGVPASVAVPLPLSTNVTPAGQGARLGDGGGWVSGRGDGERAGLADGEGGVVGAGDGGGGEDRVDDRVKIDRRLDLQGCGRVADDDLVWGCC